MTEHYEVVVVGAGQAGLAIGYHLAQQERRFTILEAAGEPAAAWRARWDSLRLFTPVRRDSLPGRAFPGDPDSYPDRDQVVSYLEDYARHFELPVQLDSRVVAVRGADDGFEVELADRRYLAGQVVVATGPFQVPFTPTIASGLAPEVTQMHSTEYRRPAQLPDGPVVVVGGGNTGYQIAEELVRSREVHLAVGARQAPLPQRLLGRDVFDYLDRLGLMRKTVDSRLAQRLKDRETLIGSSPRGARKQGIRLRKRVTGAQGTQLSFGDGSRQPVSAVIWATGFRVDHSLVELPVFDDGGRVEHRRGVTGIPGLYFLGMPWLHTRGSALLGWVKDDAQYIASRIAERAAAGNGGAATGFEPRPPSRAATGATLPTRERAMKAIVRDRYGSADVLRLSDVEVPEVADDDVLVRVRAAGLDRGAWHIMAGLPYLIRVAGYGLRRPKVVGLGSELAGVVEAVGANVTGLAPGEAVFGTCRASFAEYASARPDTLARMPANVSFEQAAAVPVSGVTALQALRDHARVRAGQRVLVVGASGGVGTFAVQIAKALGAEVTGVSSTQKVDLVRSLGADHVIDYTRADFTDGDARYDAVLDIGGNRTLSRLRRVLTGDGTLVIVGGEGGGRWTGGIHRQLGATLLSLFVRQRLGTFIAKPNRADLDALGSLVEAGSITPAVDRVIALDELPDAMRDLTAGRVRGKIVIANVTEPVSR